MSHGAHPNTRRIINKIFWEICQDNVDRIQTHGSSIMVGNRGLHQMISPPYESLYTIFLLVNI